MEFLSSIVQNDGLYLRLFKEMVEVVFLFWATKNDAPKFHYWGIKIFLTTLK